MNLIETMWHQQECPLIDGIIYSNMKCFPLVLNRAYLSPANYRVTVKVEDIVLLSEKSLEFEPVDVFCEIETDQGVLKCGGGTQGSDGFISLEDKNHELRWIIFSPSSNPFMKLSQRDEKIVAISELDDEWHIPIDRPHLLTIG